MTHRTPLLLVLVTAAALLMGCGESGSDVDTTPPTDANQATAPEDQSSTPDKRDEPGLSTSTDEGSGETVREIPEVNAATLKALRRQAARQDKVLVVDCWASWCGPCLSMFPHLHKAMKERGDRVTLISLTFDESEEGIKKAGEFLTKQDAWDNAYLAEPDSDAKDAIADVLSENWDGGGVPAVFVFRPDGTLAHEMLETRGEVADWVAEIAKAVDQSLPDADDATGQ
jgi:thiol-disulfide isomerase/thioredoxin